MRKDPGFHLVQRGVDLITHRRPANDIAFEVVLTRLDGLVKISVDGHNEISWRDQGPGAALGGGFIGLRAMRNTAASVYTHFDVYKLP